MENPKIEGRPSVQHDHNFEVITVHDGRIAKHEDDDLNDRSNPRKY